MNTFSVRARDGDRITVWLLLPTYMNIINLQTFVK
jgi:hypothetical protein